MVEKENKEGDSSGNGFVRNLRENPWIFSTVVLGVVVLVLLVVSFSGKVSEKKAGDNLVSFIEAQGEKASVRSVSREGSLYNVVLDFQGEQMPVFVTLDGKYAVVQPIPLTGLAVSEDSASKTRQKAVEVPKSDKPKVELFVMSYCPYGTQMEKAILPVVSLLKDKIDFTLRYTHFTLHGEKEDTENFRQICIREEQPAKFLQYIQCTLNSTDPYNPADVNQCMKKLGINIAGVDSCIKSKVSAMYKVDSDLSKGYGVQGSPTLVINGVQTQSARSPAAVLQTICSAFNSAPAECSADLPTASASAGFGYSSSGADTAAAQC